MTSQYKLHKSNVVDGYTASINHTAIAEQKHILNRMENERLTISKKQAEAVIDKYFQAIYGYILDGFRINTPYFNISLSIQGVFDTLDDTFDPNRHTVNINFTSGPESRKQVLPHVNLQKGPSSILSPNLNSYVDKKANLTNKVITPGRMARLSGNYLDFDDKDEQQGIFFIASDRTETKVDPLDVEQTPSLLIFKNPQTLKPGSYQLVVRRAFGKSVREGRLGRTLSVQT